MSLKPLLSTLLSLSLIGLPSLVSAAPLSGQLVKASGPSVYYFGEDHKRYVFPTEKMYRSWFSDFSTVLVINDTELASYPLGGNVTYRPGTRLVKITTDPKVYAVAHNGTLRWVQTEALANALFGAQWAQQVDDIPDAFFVNFHVGQPITNVSDYSPSQEQQLSTTINQDKGLSGTTTTAPLPSNPSPTTTTYSAITTLTTSTPRAGDLVGIQVNIQPSASLDAIRISFDGIPQRSCGFNPCATQVTIPTSVTKPTYNVVTDVTWITGQRFTSTSTLTIATSSLSGITITMRPEIKPRTTREVVVNVDTSFSARYIDIYLDGQNVRGCTDTQECRFADTETAATGTTHSIYAIATDRNGFTRQSTTHSFRVVENDHPIVQTVAGNSSIRPGERVDVTVSATDDDGIQSTEIWLDGTRLKQCLTTSCTLLTGPWNEVRSLSFVGRAVDMRGLDNQTTSTEVTVR